MNKDIRFKEVLAKCDSLESALEISEKTAKAQEYMVGKLETKLEQANQKIAEQKCLIEDCRYIFDKLCDSNTYRLSDAMGAAVENMNEACVRSLSD